MKQTLNTRVPTGGRRGGGVLSGKWSGGSVLSGMRRQTLEPGEKTPNPLQKQQPSAGLA